MYMQKSVSNDEVLQLILKEFENLAKIPRKSGHEKAVSDFLLHRANALGLKAIQDEVNNIIIEKEATPGYEDVPVTILQSHMDMVCVCKEGKLFNPLTDAIEVINNGTFLSAEGTTLGADDGIGIAVALYILQADIPHGAIRVIITVDEENGMTGAKALDAKYLDAGYLINCDSEDLEVVTVSSAGSMNMDFRRKVNWTKPTHTSTYTLGVKGLLGGHSGVEIHKGRANAIRIVGLALLAMRDAAMHFEIASISGGTARNAIPATAAATIAIRDLDIYKINNIIAAVNRQLKERFSDIETGYYLEFAPTKSPTRVLSEDDKNSVIDFITLVRNGVLMMSQTTKGLVRTSSNLGVITLSEEEIAVQVFPRSAVGADLDEILAVNKALAALCGFQLNLSAKSPSWPARTNSKLTVLAKEVFAEQNGREMKSEEIHAGLECSFFYAKNPQLDMISVGPTVTGVHSPNEKMYLNTIVPHVNLLVEILRRLK